jgi:AcrR family transcriptional regulator
MQKDSYHRDNLKAQLIQSGLQILDTEGYEGFSLRKVAKACHVSQTAPYRHFKNKDELIYEIMIQAMRAFNQCLEESVKQNPDDPGKQLREMGIAYVRFFANNPAYLRLLFLDNIYYKLDIPVLNKTDLCDSEGGLKEGLPFTTFFNTVDRYKKAVPELSMDLQELTLYCWGLVHGIATLIVSHQVPFQENSMDLVKNIILKNKNLI